MAKKVSIYDNTTATNNDDPEIVLMPPPEVPAVPTIIQASTSIGGASTAFSTITSTPMSITERSTHPDGSTNIRVTTTKINYPSDEFTTVEIEHYSIPSSAAHDIESLPGMPPPKTYLIRIETHTLPPGTVFEPLNEAILSASSTNNGGASNGSNNNSRIPHNNDQGAIMAVVHPRPQQCHTEVITRRKCTSRAFGFILAGVLIFILMLVGIGSVYYNHQ
mmetsp:Transcript_10324/g.22255  ORF Transcript_10324/g.22255 Transcript_10324/m.22255 type:complete len:220 (-) Transcript_10324:352-1011(-)